MYVTETSYEKEAPAQRRTKYLFFQLRVADTVGCKLAWKTLRPILDTKYFAEIFFYLINVKPFFSICN